MPNLDAIRDLDAPDHTIYPERSTNPVTEANKGKVFTKDVSGITELFYLDSTGTVVQLTAGGSGGLWQSAGGITSLITAENIDLQNFSLFGNGAGGSEILASGATGWEFDGEDFQFFPVTSGAVQGLSVWGAGSQTNPIFNIDNTGAGKVLIQSDGANIADVFRVNNSSGSSVFDIDTTTSPVQVNFQRSTITNAPIIEGRVIAGTNTTLRSPTTTGAIGQTSNLQIQTGNIPIAGYNTHMTFKGANSQIPAESPITEVSVDMDFLSAQDILNANNVDTTTITLGASDIVISETGANQVKIAEDLIVGSGNPSIIHGNNAGGEIYVRASTTDLTPYYTVEGGSDVTAALGENTTQSWLVQDTGLTPDVIFKVQEQPAGLSVMSIGSASGNTTTTIAGTLNSNAVLTQSGAITANEYAFAYETGTQSVAVANTFQAITFASNGAINGITHTATSADFTIGQTGTYEISYHAQPNKTAGGSQSVEFILTIDGTEIPGSQAVQTFGPSGQARPISKTVIASLTAAEVINLEFTANSTNAQIIPTGANATAAISASLSIRRVI